MAYIEIANANWSGDHYIEVHGEETLWSGNILKLEADTIQVGAMEPVTEWVDQSPLGTVLSQGTGANQPTFWETATEAGLALDKPCVQFATNDFLRTAATANTAYNCLHDGTGVTIVAVMQGINGAIGLRGQIVGTYLTTAAQDIGAGLRYEPDADRLNFVGGNGAAVTMNARSSDNLAPADTIIAVRAMHASSLTNDHHFFVDGAGGSAPSVGDYLATPTTDDTLGKLTVGASADGAQAFFNGYLFGLYIWNRLLSESELDELKDYLNLKWELALSGV